MGSATRQPGKASEFQFQLGPSAGAPARRCEHRQGQYSTGYVLARRPGSDNQSPDGARTSCGIPRAHDVAGARIRGFFPRQKSVRTTAVASAGARHGSAGGGLRQRGQPAARAGCIPSAGDRGAPRDRRGAGPARSAAADRIARLDTARFGCRSSSGLRGWQHADRSDDDRTGADCAGSVVELAHGHVFHRTCVSHCMRLCRGTRPDAGTCSGRFS